jgi:hypothetical protein
VVLVGAGTLDYKDYLGLGGNLMPPLLTTSPYGLFAADNLLADLVRDDGVPEMAIGRLPVLTSDELSAYVAKVAAYEASFSESWSTRIQIVADDNPDGIGDFRQDSEAMAALLPPSANVERIYLTEQPATEARQRLLEGLGRGLSWLNYVGHSGLDRLAEEGILLSLDVPLLDNDKRLPLVAGLGCSINRFELPFLASLGEHLTLHPSGGAIAVWAPSGLSDDFEARDLGHALFFAAFHSDWDTGESSLGELRLGDILLQTLADHQTRGGQALMREIYILLGDPALRLQLPPGDDH